MFTHRHLMEHFIPPHLEVIKNKQKSVFSFTSTLELYLAITIERINLCLFFSVNPLDCVCWSNASHDKNLKIFHCLRSSLSSTRPKVKSRIIVNLTNRHRGGKNWVKYWPEWDRGIAQVIEKKHKFVFRPSVKASSFNSRFHVFSL